MDEAGAASGGSAAGPGGWRCCRGGMSWDGATPAGRATWGWGGRGSPTHRAPGAGRAAGAARGTTGGGVARPRGHAMRSHCGGAVALPTTPVSMGCAPAPGPLVSRRPVAGAPVLAPARRCWPAGLTGAVTACAAANETQRNATARRGESTGGVARTTHTISSPLGGSEHRIFFSGSCTAG